MKTLLLLTPAFFSMETFAGDYYCVNPSEPKLSYNLKEVDSDHYNLIVTKSVLNPTSCGSRWGCDYETEVIYSDRLEALDVQGAMYFQSKRTSITMEDMDEVTYSYTAKNSNGVFIQKSAILKCQ